MPSPASLNRATPGPQWAEKKTVYGVLQLLINPLRTPYIFPRQVSACLRSWQNHTDPPCRGNGAGLPVSIQKVQDTVLIRANIIPTLSHTDGVKGCVVLVAVEFVKSGRVGHVFHSALRINYTIKPLYNPQNEGWGEIENLPRSSGSSLLLWPNESIKYMEHLYSRASQHSLSC